MLRPYSFFVLIIILQACRQNPVKQYVQENFQPVASISPDSTDFSDLEAIGKAIGEARVVMLGEQDHGDAPTFLAKRRLVKYLHEQKGFNVLAFESDFFALNEGWDRLPKQEDSIQQFLSSNIFAIWTKCVQCEELFNTYIPATFQTPAPLQVTGFDSQFPGRFSFRWLRPYVDRYLREKRIAFVQSSWYSGFFLPNLDSTFTKVNPFTAKRLVAMVDTILTQLKDVPPDEYGKMVILNLREFFEQTQHFNLNFKLVNEVRDLRMAQNLHWLVNQKYKNEKIIVWAANYHVLKGANESFAEEKMKRGTMGGYFTKDTTMAWQTYILGFTSKRGTAGRIRTDHYQVEPPKEDGFESWIGNDLPYGFIDFKRFNQLGEAPNPFYMKGVQGNNLGAWTNMFDGVFYIRDMYPCQERR